MIATVQEEERCLSTVADEIRHLQYIPTDPAGYIELTAENIPNLGSVLRTVKTKSKVDVSLLIFASSVMNFLLTALDKSTNSDYSVDLNKCQKQFPGKLHSLVNSCSRTIFWRKFRSTVIFIHYMHYQEHTKAAFKTTAIIDKAQQICELIKEKCIGCFFSDENLLKQLQKHTKRVDVSGMKVAPYLVKAKKEKDNLSSFMEIILTLSCLLEGSLEKNMVLDTACWILGYPHGDLLSGRPGWLAFLYEECFHWLTGIERHSKIKKRKTTASIALGSLLPASTVSFGVHTSSSTSETQQEQQAASLFIEPMATPANGTWNYENEDLFSLLDRKEEATLKRRRAWSEDEEGEG
ncbi:hypothetical protein EON65_52790, partial [archaeon]